MIKQITVYPDKQLSLQKHLLREETWVVTGGYGLVTIDYLKPIMVNQGSVVVIAQNQLHRIKNISFINLEFIEITFGKFDEADIQRIADDFDRV